MELQAKGFGSQKEVIAELVFNTSMVGYQEILSDPSYTEQIVVMTYPLIGNYGIIDEDYESKLIGPKGFIVREYNDKHLPLHQDAQRAAGRKRGAGPDASGYPEIDADSAR